MNAVVLFLLERPKSVRGGRKVEAGLLYSEKIQKGSHQSVLRQPYECE